MIGIDLFAGAGGMSLGAVQAGIEVRLAVEADCHAAATYAANFPLVTVVTADLRRIIGIALGKRRGATILFGGPPCQGFSTSNQRTRTARNRQNWLFREFLRIAKVWEPDWVVFENVKGVLETNGGVFFRRTLTSLESLGYTVTHAVLDATDFGVPQRRMRVFAVGSRRGIAFEFPDPTVSKPVTVKEAIGDLPKLRNGDSFDWLPYRRAPLSAYGRGMRGSRKGCSCHHVTSSAPPILDRYRHVPRGGNWEDIPAALMENYKDRSRCHTGIYHRLREDTPSIVIGNYRKNMLIHPTQDRGLSVREAARIQSFPDGFRFLGSIGFQQQQVGNAVPPLLAKAVFRAILAQDQRSSRGR